MSEVGRTEAALAAATLPDWVQSLHVEPMVDHTGEPALRVTVVVKAEREDIVNDGVVIGDMARRIHLAIDAAGIHLFPYTRFVGASEAA